MLEPALEGGQYDLHLKGFGSYVLEATLRASLVQLAYALRQILMIYFFIRVDSRFSLPPPNASLIGHGPMLSPTKLGLGMHAFLIQVRPPRPQSVVVV